MEPLNGVKEWPSSILPPMTAPILKKVRSCRPKRARRPGPGENFNTTKKSKVGTICCCSICGLTGHNKRGCKLPQKEHVRSKRPHSSKKTVNDKGHTLASEYEPVNPPMHNRGIGMYTYANGFQRLGNMSATKSGRSDHRAHSMQQQPIVNIPTQISQVAYYSDFEGQQTLRGISTMRESSSFNQPRSQTSNLTNGTPSFTDSNGRKCITSHTLQSWGKNLL